MSRSLPAIYQWLVTTINASIMKNGSNTDHFVVCDGDVNEKEGEAVGRNANTAQPNRTKSAVREVRPPMSEIFAAK